MMKLRGDQLTRNVAMDGLEGVSKEDQASGWELW